jgi:ribonuclease HI
MAKKKFYVVWKGIETGVFDNWETCKKQVTKFEGAQYKAFSTEEEAKVAFQKGFWSSVKKDASYHITKSIESRHDQPITESLAVDAACSGNPGKMEYRGVNVESGREVFHQGPFEKGTNNIGEFLAIVHGLAYLKQVNSSMLLYTDSATALAWIKAKKCHTKLTRTEINNHLFELIERAEMWLQQNSYSTRIIKWETLRWGEIPADFGRK